MSDFFKNTDEENEAHAEERAFASLSVEEAKENARSIGDYFQASMASGNALQGGLGSYPKMSSPIQFSFEVEKEENETPEEKDGNIEEVNEEEKTKSTIKQ